MMNTLLVQNNYFLLLFYLINGLFVLKYGARQHIIPSIVLLMIYILVVFVIVKVIHKEKNYIDRFQRFNFVFGFFSIFVFLSFVVVNMSIDGNLLQVDRWSAIEVVVTNVLKEMYPYDKFNHLGHTSSNLPGLFYLGLPFALVGKIGLIQPFVFLTMMLMLMKSSLRNHQKVLILVLFLVSPAYLWEVVVKSDLMSNLILVLLFIFVWKRKFESQVFQKPIVLGFICAFFLLTRGIVLIPLTLLLFKDFVKSSIKVKVKFIVSLLFFMVLISLPILLTINNWQQVKEHNPFNHQTAFMPKIMQVLMVALPFFLSFKVQKLKHVFCYTTLVFSFFLGAVTLMNIFEEGYNGAVLNALTDISYFAMTLPFLIFTMVLHNKNTMRA